jgi:hypothetical protein
VSVVYSRSFISQAGGSGDWTYDVPAGYTAIIRDIDIYWGSQATPPSGRVLGNAGQAFATWQGAILAPNIMNWRGRHVIAGPGVVTVRVDNGNADISVSGYLLVTDGP